MLENQRLITTYPCRTKDGQIELQLDIEREVQMPGYIIGYFSGKQNQLIVEFI